MSARDVWEIYDTRTGRQAQESVYLDPDRAEAALAHYRDRDARGGRPDLHDTIPHLAVRQKPRSDR